MVTVNIPEPTEEKPKKKRKAAPKKTGADVELLTNLICGGSEILAVTPNNAHWKISEEEGKTIAEPLAKVIAKNEHLKKVMEQSDSIALLIATMTVVAPRAYISYLQLQDKQRAKKEREVKKIEQENRESEGYVDEPVDGDASADENDGITVFNGIDL